MTNWSRFVEKMPRKRSRAAGGVRGSSASASTRALNSSQESSALRNCSGAGRAGSSAASGSAAVRSSLSVTRLARATASGAASPASAPPSNAPPDHSGTSGERAATVSAASVPGSRSTGEPTRARRSAGVNHCKAAPSALRRSRRATQTSETGRSPDAGTTPMSRTCPSPLPTRSRSAARHAASPLPGCTGRRRSAPKRRKARRPCSTATSATARSPRSSRASA